MKPLTLRTVEERQQSRLQRQGRPGPHRLPPVLICLPQTTVIFHKVSLVEQHYLNKGRSGFIIFCLARKHSPLSCACHFNVHCSAMLRTLAVHIVRHQMFSYAIPQMGS